MREKPTTRFQPTPTMQEELRASVRDGAVRFSTKMLNGMIMSGAFSTLIETHDQVDMIRGAIRTIYGPEGLQLADRSAATLAQTTFMTNAQAFEETYRSMARVWPVLTVRAAVRARVTQTRLNLIRRCRELKTLRNDEHDD